MKKKTYRCPAEMTLSLIGGRWKAILIYNLRKGPRRFGDLRRRSPGITAATLTRQLRELEGHGLIRRRDFADGGLPATEYALTERGESLKPALYALVRWGLANQKEYVAGDYLMAAFQ